MLGYSFMPHYSKIPKNCKLPFISNFLSGLLIADPYNLLLFLSMIDMLSGLLIADPYNLLLFLSMIDILLSVSNYML
jgi:hypothetical protein